jgi:hypothetical protein
MRRAAIAICLATLLGAGAARAELSDEIQVYTDDINAPGEFGLEVHVNTTPSGRSTPDYPGEVTPWHGLRITPEFSWGLTKTWEAGLYIPSNIDASGNWEIAGAKLRMKWLPIRGDESTGGPFLGANVELSRQQHKFSESRTTSELRIMMGYRSEEWLFAVNPVFGWNLSDEPKSGTPDFSLDFKGSKKVTETVALGLEYYSDMGTVSHILPLAEQSNTLYAAADFDFKAWTLNFGVGRGLTDAADKWTVKAIFGFAFN